MKEVPSQDNKEGRDLHLTKSSHWALPVDKGAEIHLRPENLGKTNIKPNEPFTVSIPMICTSHDHEGLRGRQISTAYPEQKSVFANNFSVEKSKDTKVTKSKDKYGADITRYDR